MNYRVLEDLINILVKKAGYSLDQTDTLEDCDVLTNRRRHIEERIENLNQEQSKDNYSEDKKKDEEEKHFLESTLEIVKEEQEVGDLTEKEVASLLSQIEDLSIKLENKDYNDSNNNELEEKQIVLNKELNELTKAIDSKRMMPNELGAMILEAFRENKGFDSIKDELELLVEKANNTYNKTVNEIKSSNIFELMDEYNGKKADTFKKIEANSYKGDNGKEDINKKCEYHNDRINAHNETLKAIEKREEELDQLIEDTRELYVSTLNERKEKESLLSEYYKKIYELSNISIYEEDFNNYLDYLVEEVENDKSLEDKYNCDIVSYKNELRTLDINSKKVKDSILSEEKCLDTLNRKLELIESNSKERIDDKIAYLDYNKRLNTLANEQQYYYVNVDVIKNEIINLWNKEGQAEEESDIEITNELQSSMYEEDKLDYTDDSETESIDLEPIEEDSETEDSSSNENMESTTEVLLDKEDNFELLDDFE